jgi:hypothetical protein
MKEEDNLFRKIGTDNPFNVPDGYFENMTSELMDKLPEKEPHMTLSKEPTRWERIKPLLYMAAMFAGAALIIKTVTTNIGDRMPADNYTATTEIETESDRYFNEMADGAMMDDYSLYVYLTDNSLE